MGIGDKRKTKRRLEESFAIAHSSFNSDSRFPTPYSPPSVRKTMIGVKPHQPNSAARLSAFANFQHSCAIAQSSSVCTTKTRIAESAAAISVSAGEALFCWESSFKPKNSNASQALARIAAEFSPIPPKYPSTQKPY